MAKMVLGVFSDRYQAEHAIEELEARGFDPKDSVVMKDILKEDARFYEERVREGGILIAVSATKDIEDEARDILSDHGADKVKSIDIRERKESKDKYTPAYYEEVRDKTSSR